MNFPLQPEISAASPAADQLTRVRHWEESAYQVMTVAAMVTVLLSLWAF